MQRGFSFVAAALLVLAACATGPGLTAGSEDVGPSGRPGLVNVTNNYALPADVSALGCGTSYRMGTVSPGIASHFVLRQAMLACGGMVELVAKPAGTEPAVRSWPMQLTSGDIVDFEITTHLIASYASVRQ